MSYFKEVNAWLDERLSEQGLLDERLYKLDEAKIVETKRAIKAKILQSYRNGQQECMNRVTAILKDLWKEMWRQLTVPATSTSKKKYSKPHK